MVKGSLALLPGYCGYETITYKIQRNDAPESMCSYSYWQLSPYTVCVLYEEGFFPVCFLKNWLKCAGSSNPRE